ncbi:hypothetical protein MBLNU230_g2145t1 [Neophaeotheca triangularis]
MFSRSLLALAALPAASVLAQGDETILGAYLFHRHGDRTAKVTAPSNLTDLGYRQVYTSGDYYRNRYITSDAEYRIDGINSDLVKQSQISITSPASTVLQNSAVGFLQGLYPPVGATLGSQELRNGSTVSSPLNGYQLIPVTLIESGSGSEDNTWLQESTGCAQAVTSSDDYFESEEYTSLLESTEGFYNNLLPVIQSEFDESESNFNNAYSIWDYIHVASIHNETISSSDLLTPEVMLQLRTLADSQQWGLAYNSSDNMRAVAGMTLAAEIVQFLKESIESEGEQKIGIQFGSYGTFMSFFGLADLQKDNSDFMGVPDYASSMSFELFTTADISSGSYPDVEDINVRFLFHNGTADNYSEPVQYPLFGSGSDSLSWKDFSSGMNQFALGDTEKWCTACGNFTGTCAAYGSDATGSLQSSEEQGSAGGNGLSPAVNGVIGALVTLIVILAIQSLIMLVGGFRLVSKKNLAPREDSSVSSVNMATKA